MGGGGLPPQKNVRFAIGSDCRNMLKGFENQINDHKYVLTLLQTSSKSIPSLAFSTQVLHPGFPNNKDASPSSDKYSAQPPFEKKSS